MKKHLVFLLSIILIACSRQQEDIPSVFNLSATSLSFSSKGGSQEISIESDEEWHIASEFPTWLSTKKTSANTVIITAASNETDEDRFFSMLFHTKQKDYSLSIQQKAKARLAFKNKTELLITPEEDQYLIEIIQNIPFRIAYLDNGQNWLSPTPQLGYNLFKETENALFYTNVIQLNINANLSQTPRNARIVIYSNEYNLSDTLYVTQKGRYGAEKYIDGEYMQLKKATKGNVNIIIMGDGFTSKHLYHNGVYEQAMHKTIDYFFSIEPYKSYHDYFNVYMVIAESPEEGIGEKNELGTSTFKNKFDTMFGSGTEITCDDKLVLEYACKIKELPTDKPLTIIVTLNSEKYAGTTYLFSNGNSIALCPMSTEAPPNDFEGLIHHEAGGHGFGFLCDEYIYYQRMIPETKKQDIKTWQELGFQKNLDFTDNLSRILWKAFIGIEKYKNVNAYEGGSEYQYGVWRSEENSCMNNNVPYFNVQSRWIIVDRIMKISNQDFSIQDFIENDFPEYPSNLNIRAAKEMIPLGTPILKLLPEQSHTP